MLIIVSLQVSIVTTEAVQRAGMLLLQVEAINKTLEQITSTAQTPPTPDISGLNIPAKISIDVSDGCEQTTSTGMFDWYIFGHNSERYMNQVRVPSHCVV